MISLRAANDIGPGPARYANVRTREEGDAEDRSESGPLMPPVGLKAQVLGSTSVMLSWTDGSFGSRSDQRYYVIKYTIVGSLKYRIQNSTDLSCMIADLRPNTQYEFMVKVVRGRRESRWSMLASNVTSPSAPGTSPRDITIQQEAEGAVRLSWQPPKITNGAITGYVIFYTTDVNRRDRDWLVEAVIGDRHTTIVQDLHPSTLYFFKIQARNSKGLGPFSSTVSLKTAPRGAIGNAITSGGPLSGNLTLYLIIGGSITGTTICAVLMAMLCCRRSTQPGTSPDRSKKPHHKTQVKPPDLWIHHDQMELKALDKGGSASGDGASSSGAVTLPRSVPQADYDPPPHHTNSLDKRTYMPGYMGKFFYGFILKG